MSTQMTSNNGGASQFRLRSQPNQQFELPPTSYNAEMIQDFSPSGKRISSMGKIKQLPLNQLLSKRSFSTSNKDYSEINTIDRKYFNRKYRAENLIKKGHQKMFSEPKTYRQFQLNCLDSQLKKVFWHRSKIHQNQPHNVKRKTITSPKYNFQVILDKNLVYTQSGTKEKIIEPAYISTTRSKFDPFEIQKRKEFLKSNRLTLKQESLFFRVRKNDFLYILKNEKRFNPQDLCIKDNSGQTPLHYAIKSGHKQVSQILLRMGSNVNQKNSQGNTPLHIAFLNNNYQMANLLMTRNAKVQIFNNQNKTPIYYASKELIQKFPQLKNSICSRQKVGDMNLNLHLPQVYTQRYNEYSPLYKSDSANRIMKLKEEYMGKFRNLRKSTTSQITLHNLNPVSRNTANDFDLKNAFSKSESKN